MALVFYWILIDDFRLLQRKNDAHNIEFTIFISFSYVKFTYKKIEREMKEMEIMIGFNYALLFHQNFGMTIFYTNTSSLSPTTKIKLLP